MTRTKKAELVELRTALYTRGGMLESIRKNFPDIFIYDLTPEDCERLWHLTGNEHTREEILQNIREWHSDILLRRLSDGELKPC